jgi:hypothetical protein
MTDKMASPKEGLFAVVQQLEIVPSEFFSLTTPYFFLPDDHSKTPLYYSVPLEFAKRNHHQQDSS